MLDFDEFDDHDNKNEFATYEQINDRQAIELRDLLNRWESTSITSWDAMLELSHIMGVRTYFLIGYSSSLKYGPGTDDFERGISAYSEDVLDRVKNLGTNSENTALSTLEWIKRIKELKNPNRAAILSDVSARLAERQAKDPAFAKRLKINDDIQGPQKYVESIQKLIAARDGTIANGDVLYEMICESAIVQLRAEKKEAEYDASHIEEAVLRHRTKLEEEHATTLTNLKKYFRSEVLDPQQHQTVIIPNIRDIRFYLDVKDLDSWAAAEAMAEVLLKPHPKEDYLTVKPLVDFKQTLGRKKKEVEARRPNTDKTFDRFKPITEDEAKAPLARKFALERAVEERRLKIIEACKAKNGGKEPSEREFQKMSWEFDDAEIPEDAKDIPYQSNIEYPDHTLCNEIHIAPSGTGLIQIYQGSDQSWEDEVYGTDVARITTYSVSFVPKRADDLQLLRDTLAKAIKVLGDIEYAYELPDYTPSGESYKRVPGTEEKYRNYRTTASGYINVTDGKVSPVALFDLDDLQKLYYLMEPVIEPSAQIAAAMNAARYAEERGAILSPDQIDYIHCGHEVADRLGYLRGKATPDLLAEAARDVLVMRALNKIDDAGLTASMMTLAAHTLTGQIADIHGVFPTFDALLSDHRQEAGHAVITYDEALIERTQDLIRGLTGLPKDSKIKTGEALSVILSKISGPLQEQYRNQVKEEAITVRAAWDRQHREFSRRMIEEGWDPLHDMMDKIDEDDLATRISDAFAGKLGRTDEEREAARKGALTKSTGLILASSAVEPALDGIHAGGRYRTRTKGSPLVRYELPRALERFNPRGAHQPSRSLLAVLKM